MADLLLDSTGDLDLSSGDLQLTSGPTACTQDIRIRCRLFTNDWFLDVTEGIPYFEHVFVKNPDLDVMRSVYRQAIAESPYVQQVKRLDVVYDSTDRDLTVTSDVISIEGDLLSDSFVPFRIEGLLS